MGLLSATAPVFAQSNSPTMLEQATATAKQAISTNLNEVIVDILRGVKTAGGEVYSSSKVAITRSIDFTMEQAPLVVKEFLLLQIAYAVRWFIVFSCVAGILIYLSKRFKKYLATDPDLNEGDKDACTLFKWALGIVASVIMIVNIGTNGMTVAKVIIAPRVFMIEYVVNTLQGNSPTQSR